jgi:hypothetical protein
MEIKQNPFSLYDFLGYLIPGMTFIYGLLFVSSNYDIKIFFSEISYYESLTASIPFIILSYIAGHLISFISSYTIEKYAIWSYGYPSKFLFGVAPPKHLLKTKSINAKIIRIILIFSLMPISLIDTILGKCFKFNYWNNRTLDPFSKSFVEAKSEQVFNLLSKNSKMKKMTIDPAEVDFFTILHHFTFERTKTHNPKFQNYVALYGFLRCISLLFVVFFWCNIYTFWKHGITFEYISWLKTALLFTLPYLFFLSFLKFYKRYSLETLMAMTTLDVEYGKPLK